MRQQHLYRNVKNSRLYYLFEVSPPKFLGRWIESEDFINHDKRKLNASSWKRQEFLPVCTI